MQSTIRMALVMAALSGWTLCQAEYSFITPFDHKSAFQDASNLYISEANYRVQLNHSGSDSLYIDGINFTGDTADLNLASGPLVYSNFFAPDYNGDPSQYTYNWGTAITDDQAWTFNQVALLQGATSAALGLHSFTMNIMGHVDSGQQTVLASLNCFLFVAPKLDVTVTGQTDLSTISTGETSHLMMTVTNNMADDFLTNTWFSSDMSDGLGHRLDGTFDWGEDNTGWFNKTIGFNQSLTLGHTYWTANDLNPSGTYSGYEGVVGGLYEGDWHFIAMNPNPEINVQAVPGPSALLTMGFGWALFTLRKRSKK